MNSESYVSNFHFATATCDWSVRKVKWRASHYRHWYSAILSPRCDSTGTLKIYIEISPSGAHLEAPQSQRCLSEDERLGGWGKKTKEMKWAQADDTGVSGRGQREAAAAEVENRWMDFEFKKRGRTQEWKRREERRAFMSVVIVFEISFFLKVNDKLFIFSPFLSSWPLPLVFTPLSRPSKYSQFSCPECRRVKLGQLNFVLAMWFFRIARTSPVVPT